MPTANGPIKCYCNSERYLALAKVLLLTDGYLGLAFFTAPKRKRTWDPPA
jgi:hypothetical protein